jgi:phosphoglycolate phosphatase
MNRLAIFDCDGTLIDGQHNICTAMETCFAAAGLPPPARDRTRSVVGLSLPEAMRAMVPEAEPALHQALAEHYKKAFQEMRARGLAEEPLYEGVSDLLDRLEAEGWLLGIATGKSDRGVALCLELHNIAARFVTVQTADRHPSKPHPSMIKEAMSEAGSSAETTVMIGDTSYDMEMAIAAGVTAVGVSWGYHAPDLLNRAGAHHIVDSPLQILELTKAMA